MEDKRLKDFIARLKKNTAQSRGVEQVKKQNESSIILDNFDDVKMNTVAVEDEALKLPEVNVYEDKDNRTFNSSRYKTSMGKWKDVINGEPQHYYNIAENRMRSIDNTLELKGERESVEDFIGYENRYNSFKARFAQIPTENNLMRIEKDGYKVYFRLIGNDVIIRNKISARAFNGVSATISHMSKLSRGISGEAACPNQNLESNVKYLSIFDGIDLDYTVKADRIKENITVRNRTANYNFAFKITADNMRLILDENTSTISFYSVTNTDLINSIFSMPAPYMFDKAGNESKNIKYKLEKIKEYEYILYIEPDSTWINRPEREFPVVIDPTVVISGTNDFIYKIVSDTVNYSGESSFYKSEGNYRKLGYFMGNASSSDVAKLFGETYLYIGIRNIKELYKGRVDSAVLFLPVLAGPEVLNTNGYFSVYGITEENWYNQTLDWKNKPAEDEYSIVAHAVPEQYSASEPDRFTPYYLKIDLTAALSSDYAGFVIKADQPTSGNSNVQNSILVPSSGSNEGVQFIVSYTAKNRLSVGRKLTQSCNRAGTGTIDLYSGELNFEHVDLNLSGTQLPINITHIYNSNNYSKESDYTYKCGAGWRMSFMQTLKKQSALVGKNYGDGEAVCYEYIDAAGKSHEISTRYYKNYTTGSGSSLKSYKIYGQYEEDKGFKAEISNDTYVLTKDGQNLILTDEAGNVLKFDESTGRIVAVIKAGDGMRFDIWYGENYIEMYDTNYRTVRFNFENNYLKEIIFNSETVCSFTYKTVYGLTALSKISYGAENSEYYSTFDYDSSRGNLFKITDPAGLILEYKHNFDKKLYTTGYYIKTETDNICYNSNTNAGISTGSLKVADEVTITYNTRLTSGQRYPELPYAEYSIDNFTTVTNYAGAKSYFIFGADGSLQMSYDEKGNIEAIHTSSKIEKINDCNVVESTIMSASVLGTAGIFDDGEINHENYFDGYYFTQRQKRDYATYNNPASGWYLLVAALEGVLISGDSVNSLDSAVSKHIPYAVIKVVKTKTDGTKEEEFACFNASVSGMAKSQLAVLPFYVGRRNEDENNDYSDVVSMTISGEVYGNPNNVNITGWQLRKAAVGSKAVIHDKDYVLTQSYKNKFKIETTTDITKRSGNKIVSTQKRGSETVQSTSTYDSYNRIKEQINGLGVVSTYTYQNGNLVAEEVASGGEKMRKEYNYDSSASSLLKYNALISATDESNNTVDYQYNSYGYVKRLTYPQISQNIDYTYNGIEGLLKEVKAVANSSQFVETTSNTMSYNKGYLTRLKHSGCTYDFTYDGFGRITNVYLGNVAIIKTAYTDNGTNIDGVTGATKKTITGYYGMIKPYGKFVGNIYAGNLFASADLDEPVVYASYYNKYGEIIEVRRAFGEDITHTFTSSERYISVSETLNNGVRSVTYSVGESRYVYEYDAFTGEQKSSTEYDGTTEKIKFRTVSLDAFGRTAEDNISVDGGSLSCSYSYAYKAKTDEIETINLKKNNAALFSSGITADGFGRVKNRQFKIGSNVLLKEDYLYNSIVKSGVTYATPRVATATLTAGQSSRGYKYTYGANNNITAINNLSNNLIVSYAYDGLNRLIRENVVGGNITVYKYDAGGNIRYKKIFPYSSYSGQSTSTLLGSSSGKTINYGYSSTVGDRLISYNGSETVEYDNFGNPQKWFKHGTNSSSLGYTLTWEECTQLASITDDSTGALYSYKYNDQGIRTEKTVGGVTHSYYLNGTQIISEKIGNNTLLFYYDSTGVCGFNYNGTDYYYQKNIQGDIERIYNNQGALYAEYSYDAWGKCTIKSNVNNIAAINPFRYRGYYLDDETGLYYLNARYYDPEISRFISPDSTDYLDTESINGLNLYAYGGNISDNFIFQNTFNKHYRSNNVNLNEKIKSNNRQTTVSYSGKNSHVYMVHKTISLIQNKVIAGVLGNFSYTHTRQLNVAGALYTYSNYGNSGISYGIGINVSDWLGISGYYSNNLGVGVGVQITPWITVGAEVSLFEGITISGGIINGNDTYEISVSVGWGTIVGYMIASGLAVSPIPGGRILGGLVALVTFLFV